MRAEICKTCEGVGTIRIRGYYNDETFETCIKCKGSGKVKVSNFCYEVPFYTDANIINIYETNIINHIRELEKVARTSYETEN